jgi:hypothetical protein
MHGAAATAALRADQGEERLFLLGRKPGLIEPRELGSSLPGRGRLRERRGEDEAGYEENIADGGHWA